MASITWDADIAEVYDETYATMFEAADTIMNVTTQDDQLAVFANAAAHLAPGGCFVVEVIVPLPAGKLIRQWCLRRRLRSIARSRSADRRCCWYRWDWRDQASWDQSWTAASMVRRRD